MKTRLVLCTILAFQNCSIFYSSDKNVPLYALLSTCIRSDNNHRVLLINDRRNPEIWS